MLMFFLIVKAVNTVFEFHFKTVLALANYTFGSLKVWFYDFFSKTH